MSSQIDQVLLSWPTDLEDYELADTPTHESWIQVAKTGSFVSQRYGKFSITKDDLKSMLSNYQNVTPKAPTQLAVDYDHLSMDPQKPGDGVAAGWMKDLELREDGDQLWAKVDWTDEGASHIEKKHYRYVSPSFVKDYVYKDGKKIGATLLAAAITNHPFLEGMAALTLSGGFGEIATMDLAFPPKKPAAGAPAADDAANPADDSAAPMPPAAPAAAIHPAQPGSPLVSFPAMVHVTSHPGGLPSVPPAAAPGAVPAAGVPAVPGAPAVPGVVPPATPAAAPQPPQFPPSGMAAGQRVSIQPQFVHDPSQVGQTFQIVEVVGEGDDAFVSLKGPNGVTVSWFRATELQPAAINPSVPQVPAVAAQPGGITMSVFKMRDAKGAETEINLSDIPAEIRAALKKETVPDGSVVVEKTTLDGLQAKNTELEGKVTNLSTQVTALATTAADEAIRARGLEVASTLERLSKEGKVNKTERDWATETFKDSVDLAGFRKWAATKTQVLVRLNTEIGSGLDDETPDADGKRAVLTLSDRAQAIVKEKGISFRDALLEAGRLEADAAETYRESFGVRAGS